MDTRQGIKDEVKYNDIEQNTQLAAGTKRSRVTKACDVCRRKKIRCQFEDSNKCTTCMQYDWDCTFNDTTKKRGPPKGYIESLENRLRKMETLLEKINSNGDSNSNQDTHSSEETHKEATVALPNSVEHSKVVRYLGSSSGYYLMKNILTTENEEIVEIKQDSRRPSLRDEFAGTTRLRNINVNDDDIMVVRDKTLAEHVDQLKTERLDFKDDIGPKSLIDKLVARFFQIGHTSIPVVEKEPFLDAYEGRTQPPPPPLLTYAICIYACVITPKNDSLFEEADVNRQEFVDTLLEHASNLIRKEYLSPRFTIIQALVLLAENPSCDNALYRNWLRVGMAVRMAQDLGLHRTLDKLPLTEEMFEANKRLWYCVYITDRWCCAVMGRPLAIADADCDIDLPHPKGGTQGNKDYSLFVNFAKLSGILGEVLRRIFSPRAKAQGYKTITAYHTVQSIHRMLNDWLQQLPDHQRITPEEAISFCKNQIMSNKIREAGPLMVCYHNVNILLYRTFLVSDRSEVWPDLYEEAVYRCTEAAKNTIDIARLLSPLDIVHFGWNYAGYSVFQACLIHVYNCTSSITEIANAARQYVQISIHECIHPMNQQIDIPNHALSLIKTLLDLIGVEKKENSSEGSSTNNNDAEETPNTNQTNLNTTFIEQPHPSPMSVHAIISDWNQAPSDNNTLSPPSQSNTTAPNIASTAVWQSLFTTAATPFFDSGVDWQSKSYDDKQKL
ncbi:fungal-specific transcription factor domain-containing protein [Gilbertella persicaria]|uniref:fungal-specific transcription factor domain-containing protein n=1 Tax=Gilbertella persicaria TaxID=101096 RepID=UPI00221FFD3C|nr:fungal-specific transcription factor domain-containing protein [Gilbertella persicaria]KAI8077365.1 fungal-specific transcription factor domain-containing protein [Gilbertella persicaria]